MPAFNDLDIVQLVEEIEESLIECSYLLNRKKSMHYTEQGLSRPLGL
jgi:hypothetical protein